MAINNLWVACIVSSWLAAMLVHPALAQQKFPSKPIRIVLGSTPGATPDILARLIGIKMSDNWGQPVVIDNRVGASGALAASVVARSAPDGYTLLATSAQFAIRAALVPNLPFDSLRDFAGVTEIGNGNSGIVVGPSIGVKSVKELVALAQAQPGKVFFSSAGAGSADHLLAERFRLATGIKAQHVGFKGQSEAQIEVSTGRIHFTYTGLTSAVSFIKDGKLLPLALTRKTSWLPEVPLLSEVVPGWNIIGAQAILAPAGTPLAIRQQLSKEIARILNLPDIRERLQVLTFDIAYCTPEEHDQKLRADIAAFAKIVKEAGLRSN
jgi:tripartite-type tricarboxylate transporter receptor subunit TctC